MDAFQLDMVDKSEQAAEYFFEFVQVSAVRHEILVVKWRYRLLFRPDGTGFVLYVRLLPIFDP